VAESRRRHSAAMVVDRGRNRERRGRAPLAVAVEAFHTVPRFAGAAVPEAPLMSTRLSTLPPPSSRPGLARCSSFPTPWGDSYDRATPEERKLIAMARFPLTGLGKRECARLYGKSKSAVHYWLSPLSEDRCPPAEFLRFLDKQIEQRAPVMGAVRCA
jgi:hypothetical protein